MKVKKILILAMSIFFIISLQMLTFAHSGRTDASGGHRDNKNKSGLGYYHYHCGGYPPHLHNGGVCPYRRKSVINNTYTVPKTVYATKIKAVNVPDTIYAGESIQLEAKVYPDDAKDKSIEWESENSEIVTVTSSGKLSAVGVGSTTVIASTSRGTKSEFSITVKEVFAEKIEIIFSDKGTGKVEKGKQIKLGTDIIPENTTNKMVEWYVSNTSIAVINENGILTAISPGIVTVTARTSNGIETKMDIEVYSHAKAGIVGVCSAATVFGGAYYLISRRKKKDENE